MLCEHFLYIGFVDDFLGDLKFFKAILELLEVEKALFDVVFLFKHFFQLFASLFQDEKNLVVMFLLSSFPRCLF